MAVRAQIHVEEHIPEYANWQGQPEKALGRKEMDNVREDTTCVSIQTDISKGE